MPSGRIDTENGSAIELHFRLRPVTHCWRRHRHWSILLASWPTAGIHRLAISLVTQRAVDICNLQRNRRRSDINAAACTPGLAG